MAVNFGSHYLLVYNVSLEEWCERYDLKPFTGECKKCGRVQSVSKPFIAQARRGLCAETCACGNKVLPFTFIDFNYPSTGAKVSDTEDESATVLVFSKKKRTEPASV